MFKRILVIILGLVILLSGISFGIGLFATDMRNLNLRPGERRTFEITIANTVPTKMLGVVKIQDIRIAKNNSIDFVAPGTTARSCASWIKAFPSEVLLPVNGKVKGNVQI